MESFACKIEHKLEEIPENIILEAGGMHAGLFPEIPETAYYKTLERLSRQGDLVHLAKGIYYRPLKTRFGIIPISENEILRHYIADGKGIVVGYKLFNRERITAQVGKRAEVLSNALSEDKKTVGNVLVLSCDLDLNEHTIPVIETLEILQNYSKIEDADGAALAAFMKKIVGIYSDNAAVYVLKNRKYKKSTIAFFKSFLDYFNIENSLGSFLSNLSTYAIPEARQFYESA